MTTKSAGLYAADGSTYVTLADGSGNLIDPTYPPSATAVVASSGTVAAGVAAATLPAVAAKTNYITGFEITSTGATAASVVAPTVATLIGSKTLTYAYAVVAGATLSNQPLVVQFSPAIPASAVNTAITVSVPSLGAGNTNCTVNVHGYVV